VRRALAATVGAALTLACCASAGARVNTVSISTDQIVMRTPGAVVLIDRNPFRIQIRRANGAAALSEVANPGSAPLPMPPTVDPVPPGTDNPAAPTLYAPLAFLVGTDTLRQYESAVWDGDPMSGMRAGVWYGARRVVNATAGGGGVRMTLATTDPSGRRLLVSVRPIGSAAVRVSALASPAAGVAELGDSFSSGADEGFFGFGGRHNALDQRGNTFSSFVEEENIGNPETQPPTPGATHLFPNGPEGAYYPQAEFYSSRPYGFLLAQPQLARFKLDSDRPDAWNVTVSAPSLDYVVAPGSAPTAIGTLTRLSGRQAVPPRWALGPMLDRLVKNFGETEQDYESNVSADVANIKRYRLPLTAYRIEGWGFRSSDNDGLALITHISFAMQKRVIAQLRRLGIHPLVYLRSWITPGSAPAKRGLVVRDASGQPYQTTGTVGHSVDLLDFTNPAAVRFWKQEVAKALDLGADGFMQDFGEEVLYDMHFADGETGVTMHNRYPIDYERATRQEVSAYERQHPGRRIWFFSRAGYSGLPGSTAYEGGNFPGDETTDWAHASGLAALTSDMLSRAVDGAYGYGTDIGGYADYTSPPTTKELFLRWAEWAALSPVFRLHGSGRSGTHTPWSYDAQTVAVYKQLSRLHLAAVPLILRLWRQAAHTGIPVTRPLWLQYPGDRRAWSQDQEWLLGPDVLVAPVVTQGASSRSVYFPRGCWRAPGQRTVHRGPLSASVYAPLTRLPYFFRCGTAPFRP